MIVYAVELAMPAALRAEYLAWLDGHVGEMLALPGFLEAVVLIRTDPPPPAGGFVVAVHYRLRDRAALDAYFAEYAEAMRAAGLARFGDWVHAARQVLETA